MAITEVRKLPEDKQDAIAALIIKELEDERRWDRAFLSSQEQLSQLAQRARASIRTGTASERAAGRGPAALLCRQHLRAVPNRLLSDFATGCDLNRGAESPPTSISQ